MTGDNQDRLAYWRSQERDLEQMLDDLPASSIGRSSLEKALSVATEMVAHYEQPDVGDV